MRDSTSKEGVVERDERDERSITHARVSMVIKLAYISMCRRRRGVRVLLLVCSRMVSASATQVFACLTPMPAKGSWTLLHWKRRRRKRRRKRDGMISWISAARVPTRGANGSGSLTPVPRRMCGGPGFYPPARDCLRPRHIGAHQPASLTALVSTTQLLGPC